MSQELKNKIELLSHKPGVYQFFDEQGNIIYIGKAKDLKKRVSSYFNRNSFDNAKLRILVSKIVDLKHVVVGSESDALLLENNLIKKYQPRYNILLKDDKTYPWICIKNEPFPRVFSTRRLINDGSRYFGPYTSGVILKTILELVNSIFPLRTCNYSLTDSNIKSRKFAPCLELQLGNCLAPCIGNQQEKEYLKNIDALIEILNGNVHSISIKLKKQMTIASDEFRFEEAHKYKLKVDALKRFQAKSTIVSTNHRDLDVFSIVHEDQLVCVNYIKIIRGSIIHSQNIELKRSLNESDEELLVFAIVELRKRINSNSTEVVVPIIPEFSLEGCKYVKPQRGEKLKLLELSTRNAKAFLFEKSRTLEKQNHQNRENRILSKLQQELKIVELPVHIECFDNSNLQGTNAVSACVVFRNGKPSKKDYRHFNIKTVEGPDDYASMKEVVYRRYSRMISDKSELPQLIVIDGGKGQLNSAFNALKELNIEGKIKVIGIAKRLEEIFTPNDPIPLYLDKNSESLKMIQFIRNEAHRFGISHHRNKRSKSFTRSSLENISGVGEKTIQTLFKKFKTIQKIESLSLNEMEMVLGKSKAKTIYNFFHPPRLE